MKGRGSEDGQKQHVYTPKDDASAPTVVTEALMLSCPINTMEGRDVSHVDIPGAFIQVDTEDVMYMKIEGTIAELMTTLDLKLY
eukprot:2976649-Ditylum_brightwellii.AAC.1